MVTEPRPLYTTKPAYTFAVQLAAAGHVQAWPARTAASRRALSASSWSAHTRPDCWTVKETGPGVRGVDVP